MKLEKRVPSGREKDEAAIELLAKLREKLHSENVSTARLAAFNLSWKQEDGLDIFKETLFGNFSRTAKKAAAYGLRSMKGRMKKLAVEVLNEGLKHPDRTTRAACEKALLLMAGGTPKKSGPPRRPRSGKPRIRSVSGRGGRSSRPNWRGSASNR
ncbi:MAG: hypothetical protein JSW27_18560 [Phycisphaerales bacterium]|nr:MAG: hypothetical protein JSW27_18560 [Phycisphaerales bacterium]